MNETIEIDKISMAKESLPSNTIVFKFMLPPVAAIPKTNRIIGNNI